VNPFGVFVKPWHLVVPLLLAGGHALAGDFLDTRISFAFADDNLLANSGETNPNSPTPGFGAGTQNNQFFDNFNTKYSGFETLSNLTLYKKTPGFFEGLTTEGALSLLFLLKPSGSIDLRDNSTYIRLAYKPFTWTENENLSLTAFPVSSDRFRLGYAYRISWGGNNVFTAGAAPDGIPGIKLQITKERWYAFLGMKTALLLNNLIKEKVRLYGFLGGAGVDVLPTLRLEASGGYFQKGLVPGLANQGIEAPVNSVGGSAQAVFHKGAPVGTSVDFKLYKNDPEVFQKFFAPEPYPGGFAVSVSVEGSGLVQSLEDPDVFARTVPQPAYAAAVQARFKWNYLRWHVLALYRSLSFIQFDVPGIPPFRDFPDGTFVQPEMFVAGGVDYHFSKLHLTPGLILGIQQPAAYTGPDTNLGGNTPSPGLIGRRTVVVRDVNLLSILPTDYDPVPIFSAKATFRWDLSESVASIGELYYTRDPNRTTFKDDVFGIAQPTFESEHGVGFNLILQARF
jgi:hypothetical protein